ncbi:aldo/keto reductase [Acidobacteria bacterium AH-259-A15]|nr:aldo/keto reductase [Acidobacteria bacterium AH-259-A15]
MRYRRLGRTGYEVSEIGFGTWGIGKQMWRGGDDSESLRALHRAVDQGLNFIDTALAYGQGHSERLVGRFLKERKERIYVATKAPPKNQIWPARGSLEEVFPHDHIVKCTEMSLRNLDVETIDLLQLHVWNSSWIRENEWHETLEQLQEQGKVAHFGVSINDHQPNSALEVVQSGKIDTVQVIYNIFDQSPQERLFPLCLEKQVGVIARVPFDEGALTGDITPETEFPKKDWRNLYFQGGRKRQVYARVEKLRELLDGEARTLPELALKFCLHHQALGTVIPGMRSVKHVEANIAVSDQARLSQEMTHKLQEHRWKKNFYPYI